MTKFLIPEFLSWLQPVDRDGRPQLEVGRPTRSTDVHSVHASVWLEGRSTVTVDRPESSALWKAPIDRAGRPDRETALCIQASVDRAGRPVPQRSEI